MHRRSFLAALPALTAGLLSPTACTTAPRTADRGTSAAARSASAQHPTSTLRIATSRADWARELDAWGASLRAHRLAIRLRTRADERALVQRLRAREIDGAVLGPGGIAELAYPALVLQAPGLFPSHDNLDRALTLMSPELRALFAPAGVALFGWSNGGADAHLFDARAPQPRGARSRACVGDRRRSLSLGGVLGALAAGRIDTVLAPAGLVRTSGWHTHLRYATRHPGTPQLRATLLASERVESLPAELQQVLRVTAAEAHDALHLAAHRDDEREYETLTTALGITELGTSSLDLHLAWQSVEHQASERLVGRVHPRELFDRARATATVASRRPNLARRTDRSTSVAASAFAA